MERRYAWYHAQKNLGSVWVGDNRVDCTPQFLDELLGNIHGVVDRVKERHEHRVAILFPADLGHVRLERLDNHLTHLCVSTPHAPRCELGAVFGVKPAQASTTKKNKKRVRKTREEKRDDTILSDNIF